MRCYSMTELGRDVQYVLQITKHICKYILGGGFNPSAKYERQIGLFPRVGVKIEK